MYRLSDPVTRVKGVGSGLAESFNDYQIQSVLDLALWLPLRYEDRSERVLISDLQPDQLVTIEADVVQASQFRKSKRTIQRATAVDASGKVKLMWFNNRFVIDQIKRGDRFLISGKLGTRGTMIQPILEKLKADGDNIHTGRLVPIYSRLGEIKQGNLRRLLKETTDALGDADDDWAELKLGQALKTLHFPDSENEVRAARERVALEELLGLIRVSRQIKADWQKKSGALAIKSPIDVIPDSIPFELTAAQLKSLAEILTDLTQTTPMNRLLIGDVGSGKTVVVGVAAYHLINQTDRSVALVAPTQILAEQHFKTLSKLFPDLRIQILTSQHKKLDSAASLVIGTHAVINQFHKIKPCLIIYDEQHRFGVGHRSQSLDLPTQPHLLTMSATPIPRSLMLTIFSHLNLSAIDQMPPGRQPVKSWVIPETKRKDAYTWVADQIKKSGGQALIVCPFIDPSHHQTFENVKAATTLHDEVKPYFKKLGLLHGRQSVKDKKESAEKLYSGQIDALVTTPVIEVGLDVPQATYIIIEGAERFGLASLHQLRGRVGRAGQQAYCLLMTSPGVKPSQRLKQFSTENNGLKLAEQDLQRRGGGNLFGTEQSGFDQLKFSSWTNLELIAKARKTADELPESYQPKISVKSSSDVASN